MLFRCKNCGGNVIFSPAQGKMFCPHCDGVDCEERERGSSSGECINCGAQLTVEQYNSTCKCEYCSSYMVLEERVDGEYRPNYVIPFKVDKKDVVSMLQKEFKSRIFTPDSFLSESTLEEMNGMYVPFWLYDYLVNLDFSAKGTKIRVWTTGDTEYTETSYYRIERDLRIDFDRIPVDASIAMGDEVMNLMEPFDYSKLEGFDEKYMSGFYGEIYNEGADALEERAKAKCEQDAEALLRNTVSEYTTVTPEHKNIDSLREKVNYVLLPVWRYIYKYKDKDYDFYVNGQNGKIVGSTPVSRKKVLAYGGTVFAAAWMILSLIFGIMEVI